jgi:hypothetical protein
MSMGDAIFLKFILMKVCIMGILLSYVWSIAKEHRETGSRVLTSGLQMSPLLHSEDLTAKDISAFRERRH